MSTVNYVRKSLNWPGKTEHWGRGSYIMLSHEPINYERLTALVKRKIDYWNSMGYLEKVEVTDDYIDVLFRVQWSEYYRDVRFLRKPSKYFEYDRVLAHVFM